MGFAMNSFCVLLACIVLVCSVLGQELHDMPRVVGGTLQTSPLPYQVSLFFRSAHFCGGGLITFQTVLTAASCFTSEHTPPVAVGVLAGSATAVSGTGTSRNAFSIDTHPDYSADPLIMANDIALVILQSPYDNSVASISPRSLAVTSSSIGTMCSASGWGGRTATEQFSGELHRLFVNIINPLTCTSEYNTNIATPNFIAASQVCTLPTTTNQGFCTTDLGGPLICNELVSGVLSWGLDCGLSNPVVVTNTVPFNSWIETTRTLREGEAGSSAETMVFSSLLLSISVLLNSYSSF